jgi:hypothetical protein
MVKAPPPTDDWPPPRRELRRFKLDPKYPHLRSEGLTARRNAGTHLQEEEKHERIRNRR